MTGVAVGGFGIAVLGLWTAEAVVFVALSEIVGVVTVGHFGWVGVLFWVCFAGTYGSVEWNRGVL